MQRPNFHTTLAHAHESAGADSFAIPNNVDVRTLETYHGLFRRFIANSSNHVVERSTRTFVALLQSLPSTHLNHLGTLLNALNRTCYRSSVLIRSFISLQV